LLKSLGRLLRVKLNRRRKEKLVLMPEEKDIKRIMEIWEQSVKRATLVKSKVTEAVEQGRIQLPKPSEKEKFGS